MNHFLVLPKTIEMINQVAKYWLILFFCGITFSLSAQQDEIVFKHYVLNHVLVNPAAVGFYDEHQLRLNMRNQFAGFPGAPRTYSLGYNGPLGNTFGLGLNVLTEDIASIKRNRLQLNTAFKFDVSENFKLNVGFSTEFHQMRVPMQDFNNPLFDQGDLLLQEAQDGIMIVDAALGIYGRLKEHSFFSLTIPNLVESRVDQTIPTSLNTDSRFLRYFMLMAGHRAFLKTKPIYIEPSMMISRVLNTPTILDLNVRAGLNNEKFSAGITMRTGPETSLGVMLGTKVNVVQVYYSYDSHMGGLSTYHQGSHEVTLGFALGKKRRTISEKSIIPTPKRTE